MRSSIAQTAAPLVLLSLLRPATPLIKTSTTDEQPGPHAPDVNCFTECVASNGDCQRFEHCQHCRTCYPDQVPLRLVSSGGRLHVSWEHGEEFHVKGVNWPGSESELSVPEGLTWRSIDELLEFVADSGFNAVRVLFNHRSVLEDADLNVDGFDPRKNPELVGLRYTGMLLLLAQKAAEHQLLVCYCAARTTPTAFPTNGLWYDEDVSEQDVLKSWHALAALLCPQWNVFAADLQNEPWAASWGKDYPEDWNRAAERIGGFVHEECVRWLVLVQGVGFSPGALGDQGTKGGYWYGENLVGADLTPVQIRDMSKLVYSAHTYGPGVFDQEYFDLEPCQHNLYSSQPAARVAEASQPHIKRRRGRRGLAHLEDVSSPPAHSGRAAMEVTLQCS